MWLKGKLDKFVQVCPDLSNFPRPLEDSGIIIEEFVKPMFRDVDVRVPLPLSADGIKRGLENLELTINTDPVLGELGRVEVSRIYVSNDSAVGVFQTSEGFIIVALPSYSGEDLERYWYVSVYSDRELVFDIYEKLKALGYKVALFENLFAQREDDDAVGGGYILAVYISDLEAKHLIPPGNDLYIGWDRVAECLRHHRLIDKNF